MDEGIACGAAALGAGGWKCRRGDGILCCASLRCEDDSGWGGALRGAAIVWMTEPRSSGIVRRQPPVLVGWVVGCSGSGICSGQVGRRGPAGRGRSLAALRFHQLYHAQCMGMVGFAIGALRSGSPARLLRRRGLGWMPRRTNTLRRRLRLSKKSSNGIKRTPLKLLLPLALPSWARDAQACGISRASSRLRVRIAPVGALVADVAAGVMDHDLAGRSFTLGTT